MQMKSWGGGAHTTGEVVYYYGAWWRWFVGWFVRTTCPTGLSHTEARGTVLFVDENSINHKNLLSVCTFFNVCFGFHKDVVTMTSRLCDPFLNFFSVEGRFSSSHQPIHPPPNFLGPTRPKPLPFSSLTTQRGPKKKPHQD
jgi:hypothetical protein